MAAEPEKKIDELLHAYARKRKADAGAPELHPATRRLLQGEVARQAQKSSPDKQPWWKTVLAIGPRYAGAVGVCAVLFVGVWVIVQNERQSTSRQTELADHRFESTKEIDVLSDAAKSKKGAPSDSPAPAVVAEEKRMADQPSPPARDLKNGRVDESLSRERQAAAAPRQSTDPQSGNVPAGAAGTKPNMPAAPNADRYYFADDQQRQKDKAAVSAPAPAPVTRSDVANTAKPAEVGTSATVPPATTMAGAPSPAPFGALSSLSTGATFQGDYVAQTELSFAEAERLKQQADSTRALSAASNNEQLEKRRGADSSVLSRFTVEQRNNKVLVRDSDGSVYEGELLTRDEAGTRVDTVVAAEPSAGKEDAVGLQRKLAETPPTPAMFRATGTNRQTRQPVVITGQFDTLVYGTQTGSEDREVLAKSATPANAPSVPPRTDGPSGVGAAVDTAATRQSKAEGFSRAAIASSTASPPAVLRARVQVGSSNEFNVRAVRTR